MSNIRNNLKGKSRTQTEITARTVQIQGGKIRLGDLTDVDTA